MGRPVGCGARLARRDTTQHLVQRVALHYQSVVHAAGYTKVRPALDCSGRTSTLPGKDACRLRISLRPATRNLEVTIVLE